MKTGSCQPITFHVPQSTRGMHMVTLKIGTKTFERQFTVTASISLGIKKGIAGSSVSVQGNGFNKQETGINIIFEGNNVASGIEANASGSWLYTLTVPESSRGTHPISAAGAATPSTEVGNQVYTITPSISINPDSGWVGRMISVSGTGFGPAETRHFSNLR